MPLRLLLFGLLVLAGCVRTPEYTSHSLPPGEWALDKDHASIVFRVDHAKGLSRFTGRFDQFDASLFFDPENPEKSSISVQIDAGSINTGVAVLDQKLIENTSALGVHTYPVIRFESGLIELREQFQADVTGTLDLHGQSKPVLLHVTWNGTSFDPLRRKQVIGFSVQSEFDRTDFGVNAWKNFGVGTLIDVQIEMEFVNVNRKMEN